MDEPAKADMTIAHSSDDDVTPLPVPPGLLITYGLIFWKQEWAKKK